MITKRKNSGVVALWRLAVFALVAAFAFVATSTSVAVVSADVLATVRVNCTWFKQVVGLIETSPGLVSFWTKLDDNDLHGYGPSTCPYAGGCQFYYESGYPPLNHRINLLEAGAVSSVSIWYHDCRF